MAIKREWGGAVMRAVMVIANSRWPYTNVSPRSSAGGGDDSGLIMKTGVFVSLTPSPASSYY